MTNLDVCRKRRELPTLTQISPERDCLELLYESSLKELEDSEGTNQELVWNVLSQLFSASTKKDCLPQVRAFLSSLFVSDHQSHMHEREHIVEDPVKHLFLWAVIFKEFHLAKILWEVSKPDIAGAVVAASVMQFIAKIAKKNEQKEVADLYRKNSRKFENMVVGLLNDCWEESRQLTNYLLTRPNPNWWHCTILSMSYYENLKRVLSTDACYSKLRSIWRGDISPQKHYILITAAAFLPFLIPCTQFEDKKDCKVDKSVLERFFSTPHVKFLHYGAWYLAFLLAFSFSFRNDHTH
ncbi:transient receptor potential cation channel subfamily M member-like 2 [Watersipora subatra]|uniref:transient receptor potential cation channel subfamily M member-like 2 n=1 Tax=Watersipora subatra TaxID=2589382 RepID=UPI00355AD678